MWVCFWAPSCLCFFAHHVGLVCSGCEMVHLVIELLMVALLVWLVSGFSALLTALEATFLHYVFFLNLPLLP